MDSFNEDKAVARLAELLALETGIRSETARQIRTAAILHDIGKVKIPGDILDKPGKLTAEEFEIVKTHTKLGAELLISIQGELGNMARVIARYHHEWVSGAGYWGVPADTLPPYVPMVSISDVLVALLSERPYKHRWPPNEAINYILGQAGTQFNPVLVKRFISLIRNDSRVPAIFSEVAN